MIFVSYRRADGGVAVVGASPPTVESRQHPPINSLGASETLDPSHPAASTTPISKRVLTPCSPANVARSCSIGRREEEVLNHESHESARMKRDTAVDARYGLR